jgi:hypothetical protein
MLYKPYVLQQTKLLNQLCQMQDKANLAFHSLNWIPEMSQFDFMQFSDVDPIWLLKWVSLCCMAILPFAILLRRNIEREVTMGQDLLGGNIMSSYHAAPP